MFLQQLAWFQPDSVKGYLWKNENKNKKEKYWKFDSDKKVSYFA
jgi:hypothetical protein